MSHPNAYWELAECTPTPQARLYTAAPPEQRAPRRRLDANAHLATGILKDGDLNTITRGKFKEQRFASPA